MQSELTSTTEIITEKLQTWWEIFVANIPNLVIALVVLVAAYFISKLVYKGTLKLTKKQLPQTSVAKLLARGASIAIVLAGLFLAL